MKPLGTRSRWAFYAIALAATLAAGRWAGGQDGPGAARAPAGAPAMPSSAAPSAAREPAPGIDLSLLGSRSMPDSGADLFPSINWAQKAREEEARRNPPRPVPRQKPQAPPLPFQYLGKMIEDGRPTVFLVEGDRNLVVREGETVQGTYRVERIDEQTITFTYLPLKQPQTLSFAQPAAPAAAPRAAAPPPTDADKKDED